ncbi:MAG: class I SAM-dependent methyltransferase [Actinomycetota bacterium]
MSRAWDGRTYDRVGTPQAEWGRAVLERLDLAGDETVLDAGCGSGRVTEMLLERLPRGRVIAVDGSASMLAAARERLAGDDRVEFVEADLLALDLGGRTVDAVLSTATFHWIKDHARLFARLHAALRPAGRLVAQCGGRGNLARVLARTEAVAADPAYAPHLAGFVDPHRFADAPETEELLRGAGFAAARAWLQEAPVHPPEPPVFLSSVILTAWLEHLPEALRGPFVDAVLAGLPEPFEADYVRLNLDAVA